MQQLDDDGGFNGNGNLLQQYPNLVSESLEELKEHHWPSDATGGVLEQIAALHAAANLAEEAGAKKRDLVSQLGNGFEIVI